jgi:hypothetical protein
LPDEPIQIFISYAWRDNQPSPQDPHSKGFVTALHEQLDWEFTRLGPPEPKIWWDQTHLERGEQFDPIIDEAIRASSMFVVMLSRSWPTRPYCLKELELFRERWKHLDDFDFKHRITVVKINEVDSRDCPPWILGQNPFTFYKLVGKKEAGDEYLFFERGKGDDLFYNNVRDLGKYLWKRAKQIARRERVEGPELDPGSATTSSVTAAMDANDRERRRVYLAVPAADMREPYQRLVNELRSWRFEVAPDPSASVPTDAAEAIKFFDEALAGAQASIHLLGERKGVTPDGGSEPIAKLQLARAGERLQVGSSPFSRILWAPKDFLQPAGNGQKPSERDPHAVVADFCQRHEADVVFGDLLSKFVDFLGPHLARAVRKHVEHPDLKNGSKIYIYHNKEDVDYANVLAALIQQRQMIPIPAEHEGAPDELLRFHRDCLRRCDSVVICWAAATAVAARAMWSELEDWQVIGREKEFSRRGMVVGPPPNARKSNYKVLFPADDSNEVIVDLTSHPKPSPEDLNPLFPAS